MVAYLVANIHITDATRFADYRTRVRPVLEAFGGRDLTRGGTTEALEGGDAIGRVIVIEFPSAQHARDFFASEAYAPLLALRLTCARSSVAIVDGGG